MAGMHTLQCKKKAPPISKQSQHLKGEFDPKIKNMVAVDEGGGYVDCQQTFVAGGRCDIGLNAALL